MSSTELRTDGEIVSLHDRRHRHLLGLSAQRAVFAALTVERQSQDRPDAHDHARWVAAVEQAIEDGWPQVFFDSRPDWVRDAAALFHTRPAPPRLRDLRAQGRNQLAGDRTALLRHHKWRPRARGEHGERWRTT